MESVDTREKKTEKTSVKSPFILVVEDDEGLNYLIQDVLQREGFKTEGARSGKETLDKTGNNGGSILLLDYVLPDMTAKEIIKKLKSKNPGVPFLIMTGHGDEKTAVEMMKLGARDYIIKDISLINMIPHAIKRVVREINREKELAEAGRAVREWQKNMSILYRISLAISQTIDMEELFNIILDTVTHLDIFRFQQQAGIFLIEEDRMNLVAVRGVPHDFEGIHKSMRIGECLCGLAAKTGEVIVSHNCTEDERHTIVYDRMSRHGHIIIPLHARGKITGILFLYLNPDAKIGEENMKLLTSIGNQIGVAIENALLYEEAKKYALQDPLTGLANRRMMDIMFDQTLETANRFGKAFSIIMLDIDYFKAYNDMHGHSSGDMLLIELASLTRSETRKIDLVVRYGGEEFLVLLPETDAERALEVAERMRHTAKKHTGVTVSLGVATYVKGMLKEELIKKADRALYSAKQKGRNRVESIS